MELGLFLVVTILCVVAMVIYKKFTGYAELEKANEELTRQYEKLLAEASESEREAESLQAEVLRKKTGWNQDMRDFKAELAKAEQTIKDTLLKHRRALEEKAIENKSLREAVQAIANQFANDSLRFVISSVTANNIETQRKKLEKVFSLIRSHKIEFPKYDETEFFKKLEAEWRLEVKRQFNREEQARIKEQIREEVKAEKERQAEIDRIEKERKLVQVALDKAMKEVNDQRSEEIEQLKLKLAEVEASHQRAVSQAQLTRSGHVYVISNIGSFGEDVFKIGMTRRSKPEERITELSGAAVPFGFDVQLMISCDDAPTLENKLHRELNELRINKANNRKEFFRVGLSDIVAAVEKHHGKAYEYFEIPEALDYRETKLIEERGGQSSYDEAFGDDDDVESAA